MKQRVGIIALLLVTTATGIAQTLPFETAAMRKPDFRLNGDVFIKGGRLLTVTKGTIERGDILIQRGKITAIGSTIGIPAGVRVIDATGKVITPGIVDGHVHRGTQATNEGSDSITADVRIYDVLDSSAKNVWQALAGGETTGLALHGSANAVGGQSTVIKFKYDAPVDQMPIADAPRMIKFALGENVTRSGSTTGTRFPRTRMGVQALYRRAFTEAKGYIAEWEAYEKSDKKGNPPRKDLRLEALADILRGKIWVQCHSYRADEMLMMVRLSQEFGFKIGAMQHALEAYKIAPELAKAGVGVSMFVDNWSFKIEGYDAIPFNAAICTAAGVNVSINTDGVSGMPSIAIDGAKTMRYGGLSEDQAMATLTINPAKQLGIDHRVGSLEVGKDGDIVIWDGHPLSVYARCSMTIIEGELYFQRRDAFGVDNISTLKTKLDVNKQTKPLVIPDARGYAIVGATVHPVSGPSIEDGTVIVQDGKIVAVGKGLAVPTGATRVDARGMHVYPGFIDAGTSMGLSEVSPIGQMNDNAELGAFQPDLIAQTAIQVQSEHFPVARMGGILSTLTRPTGGTVSGQASLVNTFGWTPELKSLNQTFLVVNFPGAGTGFAFDANLACCDIEQLMGGEYNPPVVGHVHKHDGDDHDHDHDHDEDMQGGGGGGGQGGGGARELDEFFKRATDYAAKKEKVDLGMEAMVPYVTGKSPVLLRVRSAASIRNAVAFAKKYNLKIVLAGAADAWKEAELLKKENIPVIIQPAGRSTLSSNNPANDWDPYDTTFVLPHLLAKAGVKFAFMSEDNSGSFNLPVRVGQSCGYGLSREDALKALTLWSAEIMGVSDRLGSIEPGKMGNLVIADGDPFELTSNIVGVFVAGRPVALESKFTRLRDQYSRRLTDFERSLLP